MAHPERATGRLTGQRKAGHGGTIVNSSAPNLLANRRGTSEELAIGALAESVVLLLYGLYPRAVRAPVYAQPADGRCGQAPQAVLEPARMGSLALRVGAE